MITVQVQFFSRLKDIAGAEPIPLELAEGVRACELVDLLCTKYSALNAWRPHLLVAIGLDYATPDAVLKHGDEVSVMPPVQGG
jgi:molybdopterin synthase sulfur carrier subunit